MDYRKLNNKARDVLKVFLELIGNKILTVALLVIVVCAVLLLFIIHFNDIAGYFYSDVSRTRGQLLATILTVIGGGAVIYGLYLNNKRIKEQNRQNNIADKTNNDKRFGDAIGYLNSDNAGVAIGGVYALYQLAKEDDRYVSIVGNIFSKCLFILDTKPRLDEICNIIVDLVFRDLFKEVYLSFQNVTFHNVTIKDTKNKSFNSCTFMDVNFHNIEHFDFHKCTIFNSKFDFVSHIKFVDNNKINDCSIFNLENCYLKNLEMYDNDITSLDIFSQMQIDKLSLKRNQINNKLCISASIIKNSDIDASPMLELRFNTQEKVKINGDENQIKISEFEDLITEILNKYI